MDFSDHRIAFHDGNNPSALMRFTWSRIYRAHFERRGLSGFYYYHFSRKQTCQRLLFYFLPVLSPTGFHFQRNGQAKLLAGLDHFCADELGLGFDRGFGGFKNQFVVHL